MTAGKLTKHVSIKEVTRSYTASKHGVDNSIPNQQMYETIKLTAESVFEPVREHFGVPLYISSFFRSQALNDAIKGSSKTSQHSKGEAIDIDADVYGGVTNKEVFEFIKDNLVFDQLIWEYGDDSNPNWVHVSYSKTHNRKSVLKAYRENGKVKYKKY